MVQFHLADFYGTVAQLVSSDCLISNRSVVQIHPVPKLCRVSITVSTSGSYPFDRGSTPLLGKCLPYDIASVVRGLQNLEAKCDTSVGLINYGHVAELVHATVCKTVFNVGSNPIVVLLHSAIVELVQHLVLVQDSFTA